MKDRRVQIGRVDGDVQVTKRGDKTTVEITGTTDSGKVKNVRNSGNCDVQIGNVRGNVRFDKR